MPGDSFGAAGRLLHLARVRGIRRTLRATTQGYLFAFRRWYIFYRPIRPTAPQPVSAEFEYRLVTPVDIESFAVFEPNRHRREFQEWLDDGALLFAAFANGRPVAFQCFARAVPTGPPLSSLKLGPGQIWTVDVQTVPEFRRHHVAADLRSYRDIMLADMGLREYVSSVQDDNLPALRYAYGTPKRLVDRVRLLTYFCLLGYRRISLEADSLARLEGVLAAAERPSAPRG